MKQVENSLKCKALLMKITKIASFFFFFGFKMRCHSYFPLKTGANCQTSVLKRTKKDQFLGFKMLVFRKIDHSGSF